MKVLSFVTLSICLTAVPLLAQPNPDTLWTRTYGGSNNDEATSVQQTTDGGYILAGFTSSFGAGIDDFYLVKTNPFGHTLWTRVYGGNTYDRAHSVQQTADGGYVMAGWSDSFGGGRMFYLVKTNHLGDTLWTRIYGPGWETYAECVQQTADGGYVVAGHSWTGSSVDFHLLKTDSGGAPLWTRFYGGSNNDEAYSVQQTTDGGYIMAGVTWSFGAGYTDFYVIKTNGQGDMLWTRTYGGSNYDGADWVQQTADGGYVVAGYTASFGAGGRDFYLVKTDPLGDTLWTRTYGGAADDWAFSVQQTSDGGYVVAGGACSFGAGAEDFYLVKTNGQGDTLWTRTFGGSYGDRSWSVQQTGEGGYIAAGYTGSFGAGGYDFYLVRIGPERGILVQSPNGGEEWQILQHDTVRWAGAGFEGGVKIELNRNYPSGVWEVLADSTENDGEEAIFVTDPLSDSCRVTVSTLDGAYKDTSDGDFSIICSQGYLSLVRPSQPTVPVLSWDAGVVECPDSVSAVFRLKNFGSETIVVFQPEEPGGPCFSRTTNCAPFFALNPGQMSACSLTIAFNPPADGICLDTLLIASDAVNQQGGYVRFPLSGEQMSTPDSPQVVISIEGNDARLNWEPVTESVGGCPIAVTGCLVFYSEEFNGPYWYHGFTTDTTYLHVRAAQFASGMFYEVVAYVGPLEVLMGIPPEATREQVRGLLKR